MPEAGEVYVQWRLSFPGSGIYMGNTPTDVLRRISKRQHDPEDRKYVKVALSWRAWVICGAIIDPEIDDEDFLIEYARTGIAKLEAYGEERDEWLTF